MEYSSISNIASGSASRSIDEIVKDIQATQSRLIELESELSNTLKQYPRGTSPPSSEINLSLDDYVRYGRQMIVPQVGLSGQLKLKQASVLVIGAGGLGCPALLYLVRAGVGQISIVDHDMVEVSNLHRQVLHSEYTLGMNKAESARIALSAGNRSAHIDAYPMPFAMDRLSKPRTGLPPDSGNDYLPELGRFSLVLDCTDNPTSRYLISDACAAFGIPLVSGAAIRSQGQLSVWNLPSSQSSLPGTRGPCYRCIFPEAEQIRFERCADEGVLGPTVGLVGVLMAWEAIRLLLGTHDLKPSLLLVPSFRRIKLRNAKGDCVGCGSEGRAAFLERLRTAPVDRASNGDDNSNDAPFLKACSYSSKKPVSGNSTQRITADDLILNNHQLDRFWVLDVRPPTQFGICALPNSINIPITEILENPELMVQRLREIEKELTEHGRSQTSPNRKGWLIVCRRGNDSLLAVEALNGVLFSNPCSNVDRREGLAPRQDHLNFIDFDGGLEAYSLRVDSTFPIY